MDKNNGQGWRLLLASAAGIVGFALIVSALCWLWLRFVIAMEVRADDGSELVFVLVNKHSLMFIAGWLILFFAVFFRDRLERRVDTKSARRLRRISYGLACALAVYIVLENLVFTPTADEQPGVGIAVEGVELVVPRNATVKREASPTRPAYEFTTNAYGFRDRQIDAEADRNKNRIMLVGDSFVFGSGIAQGDCLAGVLESELNGRLYGRSESRVYPVAQEGWNLEQEVSAIIAMSPLTRPDIVLVAHLPGNDLWPRDPMFSSQRQNRYFRDVLSEMRARQIEFFRDREYTIPDLVENYHRQMERLSDWALKENVDVMFYTYGTCTYQMEKYLESGRIFVQHFTEWKNDSANRIEGDGHPTGQGNRVMASLLAPFVIEILQLRGNEKTSGFSLKSRRAMRSMWPEACGPLGQVAYEKIWAISQEKTPLIRDMLAVDWLEQHRIQHLDTAVDEESINMTFADPEKKQFKAILTKKCSTDACRSCADACICFEGATGDTEELQSYICSRLPAGLWDEKDRPVENNPRDMPSPGDGDSETAENTR